MKRLQITQNTALQSARKRRKQENMTRLRGLYTMITHYQQMPIKVLSLTFKIVHGMTPAYLCVLIDECRPLRSSLTTSLHDSETQPTTPSNMVDVC